jgi:hypothetical protein
MQPNFTNPLDKRGILPDQPGLILVISDRYNQKGNTSILWVGTTDPERSKNEP